VYNFNVVAMTGLSVSQPPTPNAVTGVAPASNPLNCVNTSSAFAVLLSTVATPPACNGFVVVVMNSGAVTVDGTAFFQPLANAGQVRWEMDRDPSDVVGTGVPLSGGYSGPVATVQPSMAGNFRLVAYIDLNGNGKFDMFSYWPGETGGALALIDYTNPNDIGWTWGSLGAAIQNSSCRVEPDSSYQTTDGTDAVLYIDVTFLTALQGDVNVWAIATDEWETTNWTIPVGWNTQPGPPVVTSFSPVSASPGQTVTINGNNFTGRGSKSRQHRPRDDPDEHV